MRSNNGPASKPSATLPGNKIAGIEDTVARKLDIKGEKCPINFVKIKLALEQIQNGQNLQVLLDGGEPMQNVPRQVKEEGHRIIKVDRFADESFKLLIRKGGGAGDGR